MSSRYLVKYTLDGKTRYGIVVTASDKVKKGKTYVKVDDAVLPLRSEQLDSSLTDIPFRKDFPTHDNDGFITKGGSEYDLFVDKEYRAARAVSDAAGKGVVKGKLFDIGVADGRACYVVTKVTKMKATVEWRGFGGGDRYTDHHFGFGPRSVSIKDLEKYIGRADSLDAFFNKKKDADADLLNSLPVGALVHTGNGWYDFTRWEVIEHNGGKAYKAVGLVGKWQHDRPGRCFTGVIYYPHAAKQAIDGRITDGLSATSVWEGSLPRVLPDKSGPVPDPTTQPLLDLTVPDMTSDEVKAAKLWAVVASVRTVINASSNLKGNPKHPDCPAAVLHDIRTALMTEEAAVRKES